MESIHSRYTAGKKHSLLPFQTPERQSCCSHTLRVWDTQCLTRGREPAHCLCVTTSLMGWAHIMSCWRYLLEHKNLTPSFAHCKKKAFAKDLLKSDYLKPKKQTHDSWCQHTNPDQYPEKEHTFRRWTRAVGGYLSHATSMTAERHQPGNDCSLPKSHISSNDCSPALCWVRILQFFFNGVKQPFSSNKHRVCGYAWHLKQKRLQQNVLRLIGDETSWKDGSGKKVY